MTKEAKQNIRKFGWLALLIGSAGIIVSAVENRWETEASDLIIKIKPLDEDKFLITEKDVREIISKKFGSDISKEQLENINVENLELLLEKESFILDANVFVDAGQRLKVSVVQRKPMVRIKDSNGLDYYLDEGGFKMPVSSNYTTRVIVATGNIPPYSEGYLEKPNHVLAGLFRLVQHIREDDFLQPLVEQIHVSKGEFILIPKIGDQKILFGDGNDIEDKSERLKIFYKEGLRREGWDKYETIDLRFKNQVVAGR